MQSVYVYSIKDSCSLQPALHSATEHSDVRRSATRIIDPAIVYFTSSVRDLARCTLYINMYYELSGRLRRNV